MSDTAELRRLVEAHIESDEMHQAQVWDALRPLRRIWWMAAGGCAVLAALGGALYWLGPYAARRAFDEALTGNPQIQELRAIPARLDKLTAAMDAYHRAPDPPPPEPEKRRRGRDRRPR